MKHRILIIEDHETNLELTVYLLQEFGYTPLTARDGEEGFAAIQRERPDLVFCDIQLPKLDGLELVRRVKADPELRSIPMVALTALAMVGDREKTLEAGFDSYLSKPISPQAFVQHIEIYLHPQPASVPSPTTANPEIPEIKKGTVLVIDDLAANTKLIESLLEPFGYQVYSATGMTDAMAIARKFRPDLIISDVNMQEGSGYQLCEALKTDPRLKSIPVILVTATYSDEASRKKGLALGAARFIFRPIDSLKLLGEIEDCLASRP